MELLPRPSFNTRSKLCFHIQQDRIHGTMFKYLVSILLLVSQVAALHFYLEGDQQRCFYEELPKGTFVVGE